MHVDMAGKKPYVVAVAIQAIYSGMFVFSKAAFDNGINTYVFIFYRVAAATALMLPLALISACRKTAPAAQAMSPRLMFKLFLYAFLGNSFTLNLYNMSLKHTSATVALAAINSIPVVTFFLALILRMETIKLRSRSGLGKLTGIVLSLAGVLVIALYTGPSIISPITHHPIFGAHNNKLHVTNAAWIRGTFLMLFAMVTLSLWIVLQARLKEYPNKLIGTSVQCMFGAIQAFVMAVVAERDFSKWKLGLDISFLAIIYSASLGTTVLMYLQAWCAEMKGPVFAAMWSPLALIFTIFCSSFFLGEFVHLGSILGGILLVGGLYSVLWGKSKEKESRIAPATEEMQEETTTEDKQETEDPTSRV